MMSLYTITIKYKIVKDLIMYLKSYMEHQIFIGLFFLLMKVLKTYIKIGR